MHDRYTIHLAGRLLIIALSLPQALAAHQAAADPGKKSEIVRTLDENAVKAFLEEVRTMSTGQDEARDPEDVQAYFTRHLSDKGTFRTEATYEMPGYPKQELEMKYSKDEFITSVLSGAGVMKDYQTDVKISDIKITGNGRAATLHSVITEKGKLPWPDNQGSQKLMAVKGVTECDQKLAISAENYIQLGDMSCKTGISFDAFGTPLGE